MDGRMDRVGCEEGEEQCDVCRRQEVDLPSSPTVEYSQELPTMQESMALDGRFGDSGIGMSMSSQVQSSPISEDGGFINQSPIPGRNLQEEVQEMQEIQEDIQMEAMFEKQQRERQWLASQVTKEHRKEGQEIAEFEEQLRKWANHCPLCKLQKKSQQQHRLEDCPHAEAEALVNGVRIMTQEIQGKRRFAKFSCCFDCGVPQAICQKWKQKDEQGWYEKAVGVECQYKGVLISVVVVIWQERNSAKTDFIWKWMEEDFVERGDVQEVYKWFGQKIKWGRMEATKLCKVFHALTKMVEEE